MIDKQTLGRLAAFGIIMLVLMVIEAAIPRRPRTQPRLARWPSNLGIVALNSALVRVAFPVAAFGVAEIAAQRGWGLFNMLVVPYWLAFTVSFVALDFALWAQHVVFHKVPILWRIHRVHHTDPDFDVTTGLRFHPAEILLSMLYKMAVVAMLGPPAAAVLAFEIKLNATSMLSHANLNLPARVDRVVRLILVTPDMHRVHHSVRREETDSNYGFNFPWWDRLFGTYRAQPADGHLGMTIGVKEFSSDRELRIDKMLLQPLEKAVER